MPSAVAGVEQGRPRAFFLVAARYGVRSRLLQVCLTLGNEAIRETNRCVAVRQLREDVVTAHARCNRN
jgi:hypothetical protein